MRIGILGSGLMGGKLGTIFARAGHEVVFSYARSEEKLKRLAREAKGKARHGTPREAALEAGTVLLAVHWSRMDDVLRQAGDLSGKVVVTCSLPMHDDDTELVVAHTSSGAEELARKVPKARVVLFVSPATPNRSGSSSGSSHTRGKRAQSWRTDSSGLENRITYFGGRLSRSRSLGFGKPGAPIIPPCIILSHFSIIFIMRCMSGPFIELSGPCDSCA